MSTQKDIDSLWNIFPSISRTFAFTIPKLPKKVALDLAVCYSVCRVIDTIEDTPMDNNKRIHLSNTFINILDSNSVDNNIINECKELFNTIPAEWRYKKLLMLIPVLNRVFKMLPHQVQEIILRLAKKMAEGFLNKKIQKIQTINDQNLYCYYAAGIVGHMITELFNERGYIDPKKMDSMMPLAHDFGLALQKVNIMKDVAEDIKNGRFYWPKDLLLEKGLDYDTLISKDLDQTKAVELLNILIEDVKQYFKKSIDYIDHLPHTPEGLRIFCGDNLMMAIATTREINTTQIFKKEVKISRNEVFAIDKEVTHHVKNKLSLSRLADRLLASPLTN